MQNRQLSEFSTADSIKVREALQKGGDYRLINEFFTAVNAFGSSCGISDHPSMYHLPADAGYSSSGESIPAVRDCAFPSVEELTCDLLLHKWDPEKFPEFHLYLKGIINKIRIPNSVQRSLSPENLRFYKYFKKVIEANKGDDAFSMLYDAALRKEQSGIREYMKAYYQEQKGTKHLDKFIDNRIDELLADLGLNSYSKDIDAPSTMHELAENNEYATDAEDEVLESMNPTEQNAISIIFNEFISGKQCNTADALAYYITVKRAEGLEPEHGWGNMTDADFSFCRDEMKSWCIQSSCYTKDWESILYFWKENGRLPNDKEIAGRFGMSKSYFSGLTSRFKEKGLEILQEIRRGNADA